MKLDARKLGDGEVIVSDVCIIGAGPAGTTLAHEFIDSPYQVALLESGGDNYDASIQKLSEGEISGDLHEPLSSTHLRQIGGTANYLILRMADKKHGYRFTPLDAIDFEQRDAIPYSGWPIKKVDLDPYYERVQKKCDVGPFDYSAAYWQDQQFLLPLDKTKATNGVFMFGPTSKFFKEFPTKIEHSKNVTIYSNATVVELVCHADGNAVSEAIVKTFDGKQISFKAKYFILTSNALETPRLLLNSRRHHPNGIGNQNDNVGRYYMDHYLVPSGNFYLKEPSLINKLSFYDMQKVNGTSVLGRLNLSEIAMREQGLRNFTAALFPMPLNANDLLAMTSLEILKRALQCILKLNFKDFPVDIEKHLKNVLQGRKRVFRAFYEKLRYGVPVMIGLAQGGWSRVKNNEKKYDHLELLAIVEQTPNPNNRITLLEEKDALGCHKIKLHYNYAEADVDSIRQAQKIIGEALEETGLGRYEPPSHDAVCVKDQTGLHHMMGTTRMSKDPQHGVVDEHCCVHGMENLFIAGSAVFTTGGFANPTLTNLAISVRVADRVKSLLKQSVH